MRMNQKQHKKVNIRSSSANDLFEQPATSLRAKKDLFVVR